MQGIMELQQIFQNIVNDDSLVTGGKAYTTESGTHVPLIIYSRNNTTRINK